MLKRAKKSLLLVCADNDRGLSVEGRAYSQLLDPIGDRLMQSGVVVRSSASTPKARLLGDRAHNSPTGFSRSEARRLKISAARNGFLSGPRFRDDVWVERIKRSHAGAVIGIQPRESLCAAGSRLGVKVFDLQHGHISLPDFYYSRFAGPGGLESRISAPDAILCWDEPAREFVINRLDTNAIVVGHPSFALPIPGSATAAHDARLAAFRASSPGINRVVVVLDFYPSDGIATDAEHRRYLECVQQVSLRHLDAAFVVRPHPVQLRSFWPSTKLLYKQLFAGSGNIFAYDDEDHPPLATLLRIADGVVSTGGAGLIESSFLGVPTAVLGAEPKHIEALYQDRYRDHLAFVKDCVGLVDWIKQLEYRPKDGDSQVFESHARCMDRFLDSQGWLRSESSRSGAETQGF